MIRQYPLEKSYIYHGNFWNQTEIISLDKEDLLSA